MLKIKYVSICVCVHSVLVKKRSSIDMNLLMSYLGRRGQGISFQMICLVRMYNFNRLHTILGNFQSSKNKCFHKRFLIQINSAFTMPLELINQLIILSNHYKIQCVKVYSLKQENCFYLQGTLEKLIDQIIQAPQFCLQLTQ